MWILLLCGSNCQSHQFYFESLFFFKAVSWGIYQTIIKWSSTVAPISKIWERERERERLWVERWGKEIELEEVYGYGCLGKEIYCIPYQFHPFHSFPLVLFFPLFSPICVSVCLVNQQYFFFSFYIHWFHFWNFFSFSFALCSYSWIILWFSIFYDYFCWWVPSPFL